MASLPLSNVQNRRLSKVARSSDASKASTQFMIDLGVEPTGVGCLALVVHNLSVASKVRVLGDDASDFVTPVYDSGWVDMWPAGIIPLDLLEWEGDNFWLGTMSQNAVAGYRAPFVHWLPSKITFRFWRVEIDDTGNSDGYVQIGRVFIGAAWQPTYNAACGLKVGYVDSTESEKSLTGEEFFDVRTRYREYSYDLPYLSKSEALASILTMQQTLGTSGEVLVCQNRDDNETVPRTTFLGRLKSISPVVTPFYNAWQTSFEIREIL